MSGFIKRFSSPAITKFNFRDAAFDKGCRVGGELGGGWLSFGSEVVWNRMLTFCPVPKQIWLEIRVSSLYVYGNRTRHASALHAHQSGLFLFGRHLEERGCPCSSLTLSPPFPSPINSIIWSPRA
jgi:hypothetical protein